MTVTSSAGNTPACAGKSHLLSLERSLNRKYPRVCGEEISSPTSWEVSAEIPPRVRGRGRLKIIPNRRLGNTPACAGKGGGRRAYQPRPRKYPRVCGEGASEIEAPAGMKEIPPRVRGRVEPPAPCGQLHGNTPACAGKGPAPLPHQSTRWKYPRVCGEGVTWISPSTRNAEIPPRVRGRDDLLDGEYHTHGNTPACAGKGERQR
mgnify:CR=1 FL=1